MSSSREGEGILEIGMNAARMTSFILIGKLVAFVLMAVALVVVARVFGPLEYGVYIISIAVAGVAGSVGSLGIGSALSKFIAEYKTKRDKEKIEKILANSIFILLVAGTIFTVIIFLASGTISQYSLHSRIYTYVIEVASFTILTSLLFGALYAALIALGKGKSVTIVSSLQIAIQAGLAITLTLYGLGPAGPIIGLLAGQFVGVMLALVIIYNKHNFRIVKPSLKEIRVLMHFSNPIALSNVFSMVVNNLSVVFLGIMVSSSIVGNFGIASKTSFLADLIIGSIGLSLLPGFSSMLSSRKTKKGIGNFYNKAVYSSLVIVAPLMFFIIFFSKPLSYVAFSSTYSLTPLYISLTAIGLLIGIFGNYAATLLVSADKTRDILRYGTIIFIIQLVAMFFLLYFFKGLGLIILIFIVGPVLRDVFYIRRIVSLYKIKADIKKIFLVIISNIITFSIVYSITLPLSYNYIYLIITAMIGTIMIYPIVLSLSGGMDMNENNMLKTAAKSMPMIGKVFSLILSYSRLAIHDK